MTDMRTHYGLSYDLELQANVNNPKTTGNETRDPHWKKELENSLKIYQYWSTTAIKKENSKAQMRREQQVDHIQVERSLYVTFPPAARYKLSCNVNH